MNGLSGRITTQRVMSRHFYKVIIKKKKRIVSLWNIVITRQDIIESDIKTDLNLEIRRRRPLCESGLYDRVRR